MSLETLVESRIPGWPAPRRVKVRDIYDFGDTLVLIATDRISAFDWVLRTPIPDKGRALTQLSKFWFDYLHAPCHYLTDDVRKMNFPGGVDQQLYEGRAMKVRKTKVVPIECVVRGYLVGSGWKEYCENGTVCGIKLPSGLQEADKLPEPIFTPATKEESGHDINISFERMCELIGEGLSKTLQHLSINVYEFGAAHALEKGIIIADTKFEFGILDDHSSPILIDEVLTSDSSRFWPADQYRPGCSPPSFDKQFVRDYLLTTGWDKNSPPPPLPENIVTQTRGKYLEAYEILTGQEFPWK